MLRDQLNGHVHDSLRSCWRNILKHKLGTFINVTGLALGLSVFFALTYYVHWEFSWDAHWQDADRIYRFTSRQESPTGNTAAFLNSGPWILGTAVQSRHSADIVTYVRTSQNQVTLVVDGQEFPNRSVTFAEPTLLDLVQLDTLEGSLQAVFTDPRALAINARVAETLFGDASPLGKTLTVNMQQGGLTDYVIGAVFRVPEPSTLSSIGVLGLLDPALPPVPNVDLDIWNLPPQTTPPVAGSPSPRQPFPVSHYFKLRQGAEPATLEADLRAFMDENKYMEFGPTKMRYLVQSLQDAHLTPGPFDSTDNVQRLWIYAAIGVLVLLISGCNFIMLATLRSVDRMREVGLRKTVGGEAGQLMRQYLLDAFCHTVVAAALAALLLKLLMPRLQGPLQLSTQFDPASWSNFGLCLAIVTVFTLVSSAYPAWLMARGKPAALFRNSGSGVVAGGNGLRKMLVGIQFAIVVVLLLASAVVQQQISYTQSRDRGFSLDNIVALRASNFQMMQKMSTLVTEFRKVPGVQAAAVGGVSPGSVQLGQPPQVRRRTIDGSVIEAGIQQGGVGGEYFSTLSVPLLAGREFSTELDGAVPSVSTGEFVPLRNVVLNYSAARDLGFASSQEAIDQLLEMDAPTQQEPARKQDLRVVGVVADTQFSSVMLPPVAQIYFFTTQNGFLAVKREPGADVDAVNAAMESAWNSVMGDMDYAPLAPELMSGNMLFREEFEAKVIIGSTVLAIVIALLGLYGLVAATVVKRVKEIGVRKVMGADRMSIVALLLWQFSKPVVVANLVAWPLGYWAIKQWLQRFPYQLDTPLIVMSGLVASIAALLIAWLTVGFMATKAASAKPVLALRAE